MKYFEEAFDGDLIIINSRLITSDNKLLESYHNFSNSSMAIIMGHTHQPSLRNRELVRDFWHNIYRISDMRFTILRNPVERSISWIKAAGNLSSGDIPSNGIPFRFCGLSQKDNSLVSAIESQRGCRSTLVDNIYDCIMPENFFADCPDNLNIASSIANYPSELMSSQPYFRWYTPLPCRSEEHIKEFKQLFDNGPNINNLFNYLSIPKYDFFAIESIDKLVSTFEARSITKPGFTVPHINSLRSSSDISVHIRRSLINLFPESYLLWKHALGIF